VRRKSAKDAECRKKVPVGLQENAGKAGDLKGGNVQGGKEKKSGKRWKRVDRTIAWGVLIQKKGMWKHRKKILGT